jgi:hypothetical protein
MGWGLGRPTFFFVSCPPVTFLPLPSRTTSKLTGSSGTNISVFFFSSKPGPTVHLRFVPTELGVAEAGTLPSCKLVAANWGASVTEGPLLGIVAAGSLDWDRELTVD